MEVVSLPRCSWDIGTLFSNAKEIKEIISEEKSRFQARFLPTVTERALLHMFHRANLNGCGTVEKTELSLRAAFKIKEQFPKEWKILSISK